MDDKQLVQQLIAGDRDAWERLVKDHTPLLAAMVGRVLGRAGDDGSEVEDAIQAVFTKLWDDDRRRLRTFRGTARLSTWLAAIARREALDRLRARSRREAHVTPVNGVDVLTRGLADTAETPAEGAALHDRNGQVGAALHYLPARDRLLLLWVHVDGLPYARVAALLDLRENSIGPLLQRARRRLHDTLQTIETNPMYGTQPLEPPTRRSGSR